MKTKRKNKRDRQLEVIIMALVISIIILVAALIGCSDYPHYYQTKLNQECYSDAFKYPIKPLGGPRPGDLP